MMVWCVMAALPLLYMAFAGSAVIVLTSTSALRVTMEIVTISDTDLYESPCLTLKGNTENCLRLIMVYN